MKDDILEKTQQLLKQCDDILAEDKAMMDGIKFLKEEYVNNPRYFCSEGETPSINDVIKTTYEMAWAASRNYHSNE